MVACDLSFFTPVKYTETKNLLYCIRNEIEDYFYFGGKKAYVISGSLLASSQQVELKYSPGDRANNLFKEVIKVISYITLIVPLIALIGKIIFRCTHKFSVLKVNHSVGVKKPKLKPVSDSSSVSSDSFTGTSSALKTNTSVSGFFNKRQVSSSAGILGTTTSSAAFSSTVLGLMQNFQSAWRAEEGEFDFTTYPFDVMRFKTTLLEHVKKFEKEGIDSATHFGYIEKFDLDPSSNPQIYMRADLHGDLKSLIENIVTLKQQGLLDDNFKCLPGVHLVFLGDYCDRGVYGTQILELLMRLREENPEQVHLIRGNHENVDCNLNYAATDHRLMEVVLDSEANRALSLFYETMSLTSYFSYAVEGPREYIQCTHGLFELGMDPSPILDSQDAKLDLPVPKFLQPINSDRFSVIARDKDSPLCEAAKRINDIRYRMAMRTLRNADDANLTAYNWGDVTDESSEFGALGYRQFKLNAFVIRDYLDLSSDHHKVAMLFRGHQHQFQHLMHKDKVLVTTLPVGMSSPYKHYFNGQCDRAYIITPQNQVANWTKRAILRGSEEEESLVTGHYPLTSSAV